MIPISLIGRSLYGTSLSPTSLLQTSLMWYDLSLATASTDTTNRNTIGGTAGYYTRVFDLGTSAKHLYRVNTTGYKLPYRFDTDKNLYVGETDGVYSGVATFSTVLKQDASELTNFYVFKMPNTYGSLNSGVFVHDGPSYSISFRINGVDSPNVISVAHGILSPLTVANKGFQAATSSWYLIVSTMSHTPTTLSQVYMKVNGVVATQSAVNTGLNWSTGAIGLNVSTPIGTKFSEFITFERLLSDSDINIVETYLKNKWNISY